MGEGSHFICTIGEKPQVVACRSVLGVLMIPRQKQGGYFARPWVWGPARSWPSCFVAGRPSTHSRYGNIERMGGRTAKTIQLLFCNLLFPEKLVLCEHWDGLDVIRRSNQE